MQQRLQETIEDARFIEPVNASRKRQFETATHADSEPSTDTPTTKRQRKSRFATLSNEVEGALSVLYRELESVTSLKLQIEELQSQKRQDAQLIKLRDNDIAIMRRDLEQRRSAVLELAQLRASMSHSGDLKREVEELRARNAVLERELSESRKETAAAQDLVITWKGKLSQLLDT
jgi:DNA repair ATPase RecN